MEPDQEIHRQKLRAGSARGSGPTVGAIACFRAAKWDIRSKIGSYRGVLGSGLSIGVQY
jgi:hypothetical protein